jgi:hypothetical protein
VLQSWTGRRVGGRAAKQCRITAPVRAGRTCVPPGGIFAWCGELVPHASLRRSPSVGMVPRSQAPVSSFRPSRVELTLVGNGNYSCEPASCRGQGGDSSCEAKTPHAEWRLLVWGGNLTEKPPPARDLSGKPPTGRRQDVLPVIVLTRIHSPPYTESWPSHCQWCQMTPSQG